MLLSIVFLLPFITFINANLQDEQIPLMDKFTIEGKVSFPDIVPLNWYSNTRILLDGGIKVGFLRANGSFVISNVPAGSYIIEVANPTYLYEPIRVDINSKGKFRARKVNHIQNSHVQQLLYPLKFKLRGPFKYFQIRETWKITDLIFNPMVIMMVLPLITLLVLPKMMNAADPETQREIQQMQMPKYDMPDLSELITSMLATNSKPSKSIESKKKQ